MRWLSLLISIIAVASTGHAAPRTQLARVTVYWARGGDADANTEQHKCATGARLRPGHCAVDPDRIPYGSKVIFPDGPCVAVDTGKDVVNRRAARNSGHTEAERGAIVIDRFFETKEQALAWAKANPHFMKLRILTPSDQSAIARNEAAHFVPAGARLLASMISG